MSCAQCGARLDEGAKSCRACGAAVEPVSRFQQQPASDSSSEASELPEATFDREKAMLGGYHPWRRFFARAADIFICALIVFILAAFSFGYLFPELADAAIGTIENPIVAGILVYVLWIPVEAGFIHVFGATPAKWVFGISVLNRDGSKLSYAASMKRTVLVWFQGEAAGIPIVILITRYLAYRRLQDTGTTLWDTAAESVVTHKDWGFIRGTFCVLVTFVAFSLVVFGSAL